MLGGWYRVREGEACGKLENSIVLETNIPDLEHSTHTET